MTTSYDFDAEGKLVLPNGDILVRVQRQGERMPFEGHYQLRGPKGGTRHAFVELWVYDGRAIDETQFLFYLNGDEYDQSKCQVLAHGRSHSKFWDVT